MPSDRANRDRYKAKRGRMEQSGCIDSSADERSVIHGFVRGTLSQQLLVRLDEIQKHPNYRFDPPWLAEVLGKLRSGQADKLYRILIGNLQPAMERERFIGPIQWKKKTPSERTLKWRANMAELDKLQAARPLKPPGR